jgi:hypothetical protein
MRNIVETIEDEYTIYDEGKRIYFVADDGRVIGTIKHDEFGIYKYYNSNNEYVCGLKNKEVAIKYVKNEFKKDKERYEKRTKESIEIMEKDEKYFKIFCCLAAFLSILVVVFFITTCLRG